MESSNNLNLISETLNSSKSNSFQQFSFSPVIEIPHFFNLRNTWKKKINLIYG